jgi:beta-N-acetylhexosaminidase
LVPFRAAIQAGVDAVMSSHIRLPALDPTPGLPATLSEPILTGLLRKDLGFGGLVFTDSMSMHAVSRRFPPDQAAALAVKAGADIVLDSPDPEAALRGIREAVERGELRMERIDRSVRRILAAKARVGLDRAREVDLIAVPGALGGRAHQAVCDDVSSKAITLLKDDRNAVPLRLPANARLLYLSVIDYASGWREGVPSRVLLPELKRRFSDVTAVEVSDRTTAAELDLLRAVARRSDAVVAATFVRIASYSGRMDLQPQQEALLTSLAADQARPFVAIIFGNPYLAAISPKLPAVMLTYEYTDTLERAAARALLGEAAISGKLPITLPGLFSAGHGLARPAPSAPAP